MRSSRRQYADSVAVLQSGEEVLDRGQREMSREAQRGKERREVGVQPL